MNPKTKIGQRSDKKINRPLAPSRPILHRNDFVSASQAADEPGLADREVRRLCATGQLPATRTPGGHYRLRRKDLDVLLQQSKPSPMTPSPLESQRAGVQDLTFELQARKLKRDLRKLDGEDAETERKRAAVASAEESRYAAALEEARLQRLDRDRQREAAEEHRQWVDGWVQYVQYGLQHLPANLPAEFRRQIPQAIELALDTSSPERSRAIVEQMVASAVENVIEPWNRQQQIEVVIKAARQRKEGLLFRP